MQTPYLFALRLILGLSDFIFINICFFIGFYLSDKYAIHVDKSIFYSNIFIFNIIWFMTTSLFKLYGEYTIHKLEYVYQATWKSLALHGLIFLPYMFLMYQVNFPKIFMLTFYSLMVVGFFLSRFISGIFEEIIKGKFDRPKAVAILGLNKGGLKLAAYLQQQSSYNFKGFLGEEDYYVSEYGTMTPAAAEQIKAAADSHINEVFVSLPLERMRDAGNLLKEAEKQCVRLKFVPDLDYATGPFLAERMSEFAILSLSKEPAEEMRNRFKNAFLIFCSVLLLLYSFLVGYIKL